MVRNDYHRAAVCHIPWLAILALMLGGGEACAISIRHDQPVASYNTHAEAFGATGYLADDAGQFCTATLVTSGALLTAAHCVDDDFDGQLDFPATDIAFGLERNVPGNVTPNVASAVVHPMWSTTSGEPAFDLAVLTLTAPITGVAPAGFTDQNPSGRIGSIVGYGEQGTGVNFPNFLGGANDKLAAVNVIDQVGSTVETDFDRADGSTSTFGSTMPLLFEGTTGPGDSGGPIYATFGGRPMIVGILNGGANNFGLDSEYGDISEWAALTTAQNLSFLATQGLTPASIVSGDYNGNGSVGPEDYETWKANFGGIGALPGDGNADGVVNLADYTFWRDRLITATATVSVPEPSTTVLAIFAISAALLPSFSRATKSA